MRLPQSSLRAAAFSRRYYASHASPGNNNFVRIFEAGARDGLQNEAKSVPTAVKIELINRLVDAGLKAIEGGAFVHPKWVPQMAGTAEVLKELRQLPGVNYPCLTPNEAAMKSYWKTGSDQYCDEVGLFLAASESFNKANLNRTIAQSLENVEKVAKLASDKKVRFRSYISTAIGCPFEGPVDPVKVKELTKALLDMGCYEVVLSDTTGVGTPATFEVMLNEALKVAPIEKLAVHCHDTFGSGVANVIMSVKAGVRTVDAAIGGLGGCPYSPGATGNVSTEDVAYALEGMGYSTGIDLEKAAETGQWISDYLGKKNSSRAGPAILAAMRRREAESATKAKL